MAQSHPPMYGDATFAGPPGNHGAQRYRYLLWRSWEPRDEQLTFILCNPSHAGGLKHGRLTSDSTVDRLVEIAQARGAGGFTLVNLVAHIEPDLAKAGRIGLEGPDNRRYLEFALGLAGTLVVGWGARPQFRAQSRWLLERLGKRPLFCVGINPGPPRTPMHPLQRGPKRLRLEPFLTTAFSESRPSKD